MRFSIHSMFVCFLFFLPAICDGGDSHYDSYDESIRGKSNSKGNMKSRSSNSGGMMLMGISNTMGNMISRSNSGGMMMGTSKSNSNMISRSNSGGMMSVMGYGKTMMGGPGGGGSRGSMSMGGYSQSSRDSFPSYDSYDVHYGGGTTPFTVTESCGVGVFRCYGEGTNGGDYIGPDLFPLGEPPGEEIGVVRILGGSSFGVITVDIAAPAPGLPGDLFREYEVCRPSPLNGHPSSPFPQYRCVTTVRNDQEQPTVLIDMYYHSCTEWTKIVVDFGANTGLPGIYEVRCKLDEDAPLPH